MLDGRRQCAEPAVAICEEGKSGDKKHGKDFEVF